MSKVFVFIPSLIVSSLSFDFFIALKEVDKKFYKSKLFKVLSLHILMFDERTERNQKWQRRLKYETPVVTSDPRLYWHITL